MLATPFHHSSLINPHYLSLWLGKTAMMAALWVRKHRNELRKLTPVRVCVTLCVVDLEEGKGCVWEGGGQPGRMMGSRDTTISSRD